MTHKYCFEALDKTLTDIISFRGKGNSTFGGKVIIFCGDFRQILPIILGGGEKLSEPNNDYAMIEIPEQFLITNYDNLIHAIVKSDEREYLSLDSIDRSESNDIEALQGLTTEFLNSLRTSGLPNHKIKLKVGTPIMLLKNLDRLKACAME
ncbi:hypothetical protein Lal_00025005 [Lupinus albus]|nr:hypothetical protein Lal_00025005 [Lupinus albus]